MQDMLPVGLHLALEQVYLVALDVLGLTGEGDSVADPDRVVGEGSQELRLGVLAVLERGVGWSSSSSSWTEGSVNQLHSLQLYRTTFITAFSEESWPVFIILEISWTLPLLWLARLTPERKTRQTRAPWARWERPDNYEMWHPLSFL